MGRHPAVIIRQSPTFAGGPQGDIAVRFGDINTNKNLGRHTDSSWPSLAPYGL